MMKEVVEFGPSLVQALAFDGESDAQEAYRFALHGIAVSLRRIAPILLCLKYLSADDAKTNIATLKLEGQLIWGTLQIFFPPECISGVLWYLCLEAAIDAEIVLKQCPGRLFGLGRFSTQSIDHKIFQFKRTGVNFRRYFRDPEFGEMVAKKVNVQTLVRGMFESPGKSRDFRIAKPIDDRCKSCGLESNNENCSFCSATILARILASARSGKVHETLTAVSIDRKNGKLQYKINDAVRIQIARDPDFAFDVNDDDEDIGGDDNADVIDQIEVYRLSKRKSSKKPPTKRKRSGSSRGSDDVAKRPRKHAKRQ
jgi:hypothetical protein